MISTCERYLVQNKTENYGSYRSQWHFETELFLLDTFDGAVRECEDQRQNNDLWGVSSFYSFLFLS